MWQVLLALFLTLAGTENRLLAAMAKMLWGLDLLWIGGAGVISVLGRSKAPIWFQRVLLGAGLKVWLLATTLTLVEEAIAPWMTNGVPLFEVVMGEVYLTASANYFDVVYFHSVIVFMPQFGPRPPYAKHLRLASCLYSLD